MRRSLAIVAFGLLYLLAAKIGSTFSQSLMIFSVIVWMIAAGLFAYLVLFRNVRLSIFGRSQAEAPIEGDYYEEDEFVETDEIDARPYEHEDHHPRG